MDTTGTIHSSTPESTIEAFDVLTKRITDLESALATEKQYRSSHYDNYKNLQAQVDNFIETLAKYVESDDIDNEIADDLADCFGRELTRKIVGHIRIEGDVEIEVPVGFDLDDIGDELDIHVSQSYGSSIKIEYQDISEIEIEEN